MDLCTAIALLLFCPWVALRANSLWGSLGGGFDSVVTKVVKAIVLGAHPGLQMEPNVGYFTGFSGYSA